MIGHLTARTLTPTDSQNDAGAIGFFIFQLVVILVGAAIHVAIDRRRDRDRAPTGRAVELFLVWLVVVSGVGSIVSGIMHTSGLSDELAVQIGYTESMFQWEVGWADIAIGVLLIGCVRLRGSWMTAAVVAWAISYWGDAIGHIMQWSEHSNTAPANVWAIPSDIVDPLAAVVLLVAYRRLTDTPAVAARPGPA